jgi:hypothetical protein
MQISIAGSACVRGNFADTLKKLISNALSLQQLACRAILYLLEYIYWNL